MRALNEALWWRPPRERMAEAGFGEWQEQHLEEAPEKRREDSRGQERGAAEAKDAARCVETCPVKGGGDKPTGLKAWRSELTPGRGSRWDMRKDGLSVSGPGISLPRVKPAARQ